jgi:hypothetical protein
MKKLWMRAGVSLELTDDEVQGILGTDNSGAEDIVKAALLDGRFSFDGDSYIPDVTVDEFVREHGLPYDPHQEVNFDFSPFGGFTIRKEDPSSGDAQEGICPICGGSIEYGERESVDEGAVYFWTCMKCRATGRAGYNEVFDGNHYDVRDGNGNPFPPESEEE